MANLKAIFYLPLKDNDGRDLTAERADLETELYVCFVGWTMRPSTQQLEASVQAVLATETQALVLSEKLFSPGGLFSQMASTESERRVVAGSKLFKDAQRRLHELQRSEAAEFGRAVNQSAAAIAGKNCLAKLERVEAVERKP